MRKNYLAKLMNYSISGYNVLMGFFLRTRNFNNLNNMLHENEFINIVSKVELLKIDAIRDALK